jgi:hypothetical protein
MPDEDRQGFLDPELAHARACCKVAVVGLSGGGSHLAQQLAHNGFRRFLVSDPKTVELKHITRLVGATMKDVERNTLKTVVSERLIKGIMPDAEVTVVSDAWSVKSRELMACDLIFGAVDTLRARRDLESFARRYRVPMIDIGMKVTRLKNAVPRVAGQVILSAPGRACMWCMGFLRESLLAEEGGEYGDAGSQPQVVNVNAILAGAATWLAIDLLTAKMGNTPLPSFLSYDGNTGQLTEHVKWPYLRDMVCPHFPHSHLGDIKVGLGMTG